MYLPRSLISHLYLHLLKTHHATSPPVLILVALDPDALCACRILTSLFKRDYIPHNIKPISGYADLAKAGEELVRPMRTTDGGTGGVVVCLGVGGLVDLEALLGLEVDDQGDGGMGGVDVWIFDARRPWNLSNVFGAQSRVSDLSGNASKTVGVDQGKILQSFQPSRGGIIVFDDGDIEEELGAERDAYCALAEMPELGDDSESEASGSEADDDAAGPSRKRKSDDEESGSEQEESTRRKRQRDLDPQFSEDEDSSPDEGTPNKRRRSNSSSPILSTPRRPAGRSLLIMSKQNAEPLTLPRPSSLPVAASTPTQPSARTLRRQLVRLRRKHDTVLERYHKLGTSYSEPISSLIWNLASDLGREDNDLLWHAIVGVSSLQLSGRTSSGVGLSPLSSTGGSSGWNKDRGERIRGIFRDEVRRLNPTDLKEIAREAAGESGGMMQTHASGPEDTSIRLSPEPRFLLIRHWSLYDSMLHSPYLSAKLHIWSDSGRRKLHKLLAKMGVSLVQCKQSYTHMDRDVKRGLRQKLLKFAPMYGLEGLVPPEAKHGQREGWGFVRCWGWKACLSATDVGVIIGAILEVGDMDPKTHVSEAARIAATSSVHSGTNTPRGGNEPSNNALATAPVLDESIREESMLKRFWTAYDSLSDITTLSTHISTAQHLHRAILRTGTSLIEKRQIRHLRAFRMAVVKEGPDVQLFTHPGALIKLALWIAEAVVEMEGLKGRKGGELVMAGLDEERGVYVVVGLGGGAAVVAAKEKEARKAERRKEREQRKEEKKAEKARKKRLHRERLDAIGEGSDMEDEESESEEDDSETEDESSDDEEADENAERGKGLNRFGNAFQEVIEETGARVKVDSFEHCVVEVRKEDLSSFLESLCMKAVVG